MRPAQPFIAAVAVVGAPRAGFAAREPGGGVQAAITQALDLLEAGLAGYAVADRDPDRPRPPRKAGEHR